MPFDASVPSGICFEPCQVRNDTQTPNLTSGSFFSTRRRGHQSTDMSSTPSYPSNIAEPPDLVPYQYQPLDALGSQGDIRLVELLPSQKNDSITNTTISCRLRPVSFHDCPAYEALSYHWGDPNLTLSITLDGKSFQVTKNLAEALQCLTPTEESRFLWIDAICINQTDDSERSQQVQSMAKIYEDAKCVLVWLGLGDPDTLAAFERLTREEEHKTHLMQSLEMRRSLRLISEVQATPKTLDEELLDNDPEADTREELPILRRPTLGLAEPTKNEISAIDKIFQHPWWERVWVIQEATVARELCVICGRQVLPWNMLCQIYPVTIRKSGQLALSPHEMNLEPLRRLNDIRRRWKAFQNNPPISPKIQGDNYHSGPGLQFNLDDLVSTFRTSKATDPRDKIYALVGLAGDKDDVILDYSISTFQLYVRWAITRLDGQVDLRGRPDRSGVPQFLDYCLPSTQLQGLPSWVPDWTVSSGYLPAWEEFRYSISFGVLPRASGYYERWQGSIQSRHEPYTLNIQGFEADRVTGIGNFMTMSKAFLHPLFLSYIAVHAISREANGTSQNQFLELSERLAGLEISWNATAHAENLDNSLQFFLNKLFYIDSRPIHTGITRHEINTDTVNDINMRALLECLYRVRSSRRFFTTKRGRFGFGRTDIQEGDLICIILGGVYPYILREEGDHYIFVGNCFCQGLMLGEGVQGLEEGKLKLEEFVLH
jgi:Heterokaryon incompatibility protein (HET)